MIYENYLYLSKFAEVIVARQVALWVHYLTNYRPIALTSCLCKTFERIVNDRLVWFLEQNHIISKYQAGFRHGRSTNDQLLRLETNIREAFIKKQHLVAIFFDLEKAYDTAWKYGILKDLYDSGLRGYLPTFISNFLQNRNFRVKFGGYLLGEIPTRDGSSTREHPFSNSV